MYNIFQEKETLVINDTMCPLVEDPRVLFACKIIASHCTTAHNIVISIGYIIILYHGIKNQRAHTDTHILLYYYIQIPVYIQYKHLTVLELRV